MSFTGTPVDSDNVDVRVYNPVFGDAGAFVQMALDGLVALPRTRRANFSYQVRRTLEVGLRHHVGAPLVRHIDDIRLDDVESGEHDIEARGEYPTNRMRV